MRIEKGLMLDRYGREASYEARTRFIHSHCGTVTAAGDPVAEAAREEEEKEVMAEEAVGIEI